MRYFSRNLFFLIAFCVVFGLAVVAAEAGKVKVEICDNGRDDDRDGFIDCDDSNCEGYPACGDCEVSEEPEGTCIDGLDNDCDGLVDEADPDCGGVGDPLCQLRFRAELERSGFALMDDSPRQVDPLYYDSVDKVFCGSQEGGFRFDTQYTKPNRKTNARMARLDLSMFTNWGYCPPETGTPCEPSWFEAEEPYITIDMRFHGPGGLNLCALCVEGGETCPNDCSMGSSGDANCTVSSVGKVGLFVKFPVEDATYDQMQLHYGIRQAETDDDGNIIGYSYCGDPVTVTRTGVDTWSYSRFRSVPERRRLERGLH